MNYLTYLFVRLVGCLLSFLSYKSIYRLGMVLGLIAYYFHRPFRKKAMTSLAIAYGETKSEKERKEIAKRSFQNLMITCLEFFRLKKSKNKISEIVQLKSNPSVEKLLNEGQAVIFLSAHQANWEIPFLALTEKWPGLAVGRPINNPYLYNYVMSVREMHGGKILMPKETMRKGLKALKEGKFLGIVGDQAYPTSSYSYPLLGTRAYTAATPALLAYRANCPLVVGSCRRIKGHYIVAGSDPIWPDQNKPLRSEMPRIMDKAMAHMEKSIQENPAQWMWVHDRYKQHGINHIKRKYRYSFVLILLPKPTAHLQAAVEVLEKIYKGSFITIYLPKASAINSTATLIEYEREQELFVRDYRHQILFDFLDNKRVRRHYKKLGVFKALVMDPNNIKERVVKRECLKTVSI